MLNVEEKRRLKRLCEHAYEVRRTRYDPVYQEVARYCRPIRGDWSEQNPDADVAALDYGRDMLDSIGVVNCNMGAQGFHGWMMSPTVRWFRFGPRTRELERNRSVSLYLQESEDHIARQLDRSNFYSAAAELFKDFVGFGQATLWLGENEVRDGISAVPVPIKRVGLMSSDRGEIVGTFRDMWLQGSELRSRFGAKSLPRVVLENEETQPTRRYWVRHVVLRRERGTPQAVASAKPWASYYFYLDIGSEDPEGWLELSESGYMSSPYITVRWDQVGEEPYGVGPGVYALPDIRMLQALRKARIQAAQLMAQRPLLASKKLKGRIQYAPRAITYLDADEQIRPLMEGNSLPALDMDIEQTRNQINEVFYRQLFAVLISNPKTITALEAAGIQNEQAVLLGPATARLQSEFLGPALQRIWEIEAAAGRIKPPPRELAGEDIQIEYLGLLAQLQKRHARVTGTMQALQGIGAVMSIFGPQALDNYDADKISVGIADAYGMDQDAIRDETEVKKRREAQAAAAQAAAQAQQQAGMTSAILGNLDKLGALAPRNDLGPMGAGA